MKSRLDTMKKLLEQDLINQKGYVDTQLASTHLELQNELFGALDEKMAIGGPAVPSNRSGPSKNV